MRKKWTQLTFRLARFILRHLFRGNQYYCPCCRSKLSRFLNVRVESSLNVSCPACGSLERHRLMGAWLEAAPSNSRGSVLHVAPEKCLELLLKRSGARAYVSIDLTPDAAELSGDLRKLSFMDAEFATLVCFHVLEHIPEDKLAMAEIHRVLSSQGSAFISVPIVGSQSEEAAAGMSDLDRKQRFGQADHVRNYGLDIQDRLQDSGFSVQFIRAQDFLNESKMKQFGLNHSEILIIAIRP